MGIYRGPGGTGESSSNTAVTEIVALSNTVLQAKTDAEAAATSATASATAASTSASNAATSASNAATSATNLSAAVTAAQAAQTGAEAAEDAAVAAKVAAEAAEDALVNVYTRTEADTLLAAKANQATTYTKTEVDGFTVKLTGAQTVAGIKTFSNDPVMGVSGLTGNIAAGRITNALNASGSAPIYACRAWVNFNGTGTVAIRASGNVSSITDNGTGQYTVNFTTAMPDADYVITGMAGGTNGQTSLIFQDQVTARTTGLFRMATITENGNVIDTAQINLAIFR